MKSMKSLLKGTRLAWNLAFLILLVAASFAYAMFQGGFVSWFLLYSLLPFVVYSVALALYPLKKLRVRRKLNKTEFQAGEPLVCTIEIEQPFPFPFFFGIVEDVLPEKLKNSGSAKIVLFPWWKKRFSFQYSLSNLPRGSHHFETVRFKTGDLFGIIEREGIYSAKNHIVVYPPFFEFQYRPQQLSLEKDAGFARTRYIKDVSIVAGVREYEPGDKLSWIDWKATARRHSIMTKEFEQLNSQQIVCFIDRTKSSSFEELISFTASFSKAVLKNGSKLGVVSVGKTKKVFPISNHEHHWKHILYHLAVADCDGEDEFINQLLEELNKWGQHSFIMIMTSHLHPSLIDKLLAFPKPRHVTIWHVIKAVEKPRRDQELIDKLRRHSITVRTVDAGMFRDAAQRVGSR